MYHFLTILTSCPKCAILSQNKENTLLFTTIMIVLYVVVMWHLANRTFHPGEKMMRIHSVFIFLVTIFFGIIIVALMAKSLAD